MKQILMGISAAVLLAFCASGARADGTLTVTNANPAWVQVTNSSTGYGPATWVLPETPSTNGPNGEPVGTWDFNEPIPGGGSYVGYIDDPNGSISDILTFADTGPGGNAVLQFFSDSEAVATALADPVAVTNEGVLCTENALTGCVVTGFGYGISVTIASDGDGEYVFDPFGAGFNTSDGISFTGVTVAGGPPPTSTPEPSSLALLGCSLALFPFLRRKRMAHLS